MSIIYARIIDLYFFYHYGLEIAFYVNNTKEGSIRGYWQDYPIVQSACQCLHMSRSNFYDKVRRLHDKVFKKAGVERPQNKALHTCRTVGMNRCENFGVPKPDITQMSDHQVKSNNEADRSYFSKTPMKVMKAMSGFDSDNDCLAHRANANKFPQDWTHCSLPFLRAWCAQQLSDDGDKQEQLMLFCIK